MAAKYRIFKDGTMWSVQYPEGSTLSLPTWRGIMNDVDTVQRRKYINGWKRRMEYASGERPPKLKGRTVDALMAEKIHLLKTDPDQYFREYPRIRFSWEK